MSEELIVDSLLSLSGRDSENRRYSVRVLDRGEEDDTLIALNDVCAFLQVPDYVDKLAEHPLLDLKEAADINGEKLLMFGHKRLVNILNTLFTVDELQGKRINNNTVNSLLGRIWEVNRSYLLAIPKQQDKPAAEVVQQQEPEQPVSPVQPAEAKLDLVADLEEKVKQALTRYIQTHPDRWSCAQQNDRKVVVKLRVFPDAPSFYDCQNKGGKILHFNVDDADVVSWIAGNAELREPTVHYYLRNLKRSGVFGTFVRDDLVRITDAGGVPISPEE